MKTKKQKQSKPAKFAGRSHRAGLTNCLGERILNHRQVRELSSFFLEDSLTDDYQLRMIERTTIY